MNWNRLLLGFAAIFMCATSMAQQETVILSTNHFQSHQRIFLAPRDGWIFRQVKKFIASKYWRSVRYAIWIKKTCFAYVTQRAVRYAIWISAFKVMIASMVHQNDYTTINQTQ